MVNNIALGSGRGKGLNKIYKSFENIKFAFENIKVVLTSDLIVGQPLYLVLIRRIVPRAYLFFFFFFDFLFTEDGSLCVYSQRRGKMDRRANTWEEREKYRRMMEKANGTLMLTYPRPAISIYPFCCKYSRLLPPPYPPYQLHIQQKMPSYPFQLYRPEKRLCKQCRSRWERAVSLGSTLFAISILLYCLAFCLRFLYMRHPFLR